MNRTHSRIITFLLCITMLLSMLPMTALAAETEPEWNTPPTTPIGGNCGANLTWELLGTTLVINGSGEMKNYTNSSNAPWGSYKITDLIFKGSVTTIGNNAFAHQSNLKYVDFGSSIDVIGKQAFYGCDALTELDLPSSLLVIYDGAFEGCDGLQIVRLPDRVSHIGDAAFASCMKLYQVDFSCQLIEMGEKAFYNCTNLHKVNLEDVIKDSNYTFTTIPKSAFEGCTNLSEIKLPDTITTIESGAFYNSGVVNIHLPASLERVNANAFSHSRVDHVYYASHEMDWNKIYIDGNNDPLVDADIHFAKNNPSADEYIFSGTLEGGLKWECNTYEGTLVISGKGAMPNFTKDAPAPWNDHCTYFKTLTVNEGVTSIGDYAFYDFYNLSRATLPASITRIGSHAFDWCENLSLVFYDGTKTQWNKIEILDGNDDLTTADIKTEKEQDQGLGFCTDGTAHTLFNVQLLPERPATCTADGSRGGIYCPTCDKTLMESTVLPALGHSFFKGKCITCGEADPDYDPDQQLKNPFMDVNDSDYYFESVLWAVDKGITTGTSNMTFAPKDNCTRAQVVTFLWRAYDEVKPTYTKNNFKDIMFLDYFYEAVLWAVEKGITTGTSDTTFSPNATCTRAQVATFLWRAAGKPVVDGVENPFTDVPEGEYYYDAVLWCVNQGITTGVSAESFAPDATCTRGQIVTFLYRAMAAK